MAPGIETSVNAPKFTPGEVPNYKNPPVAGHYLGPINILLLVLSTTVLLLRLYARAYMLKSLGRDDLLIVLAWVFGVVVTVTQVMMIPLGWGRHTIDFWLPNVTPMMLLTWISQWAYVDSMAFTKLSILCFFLRFAQSRMFRVLVYVTMLVVIVNGVVFTVIWIFRCDPIHGWWDFFTPNVKCLNQHQNIIITYCMTGLNLFLDVVVFLLPIKTIWQLKLPNVQKASLIFLMGLGLMCCVFSALRLKYVEVTLQLTDATWYGYSLWLYITLEVHLGIICACLPFMKPIIVALIPSLAASFTSVRRHVKSLATISLNSSGGSGNGTQFSRRGSEPLSSYPMEKPGLRQQSAVMYPRPVRTRSKSSSSIGSMSSMSSMKPTDNSGCCQGCGRPNMPKRSYSSNGSISFSSTYPNRMYKASTPPVPEVPQQILVTTSVEVSHEDLPLLLKQHERPGNRTHIGGGSIGKGGPGYAF